MKNRIHLTQQEKKFNQKALAITAKLLNLLDQRKRLNFCRAVIITAKLLNLLDQRIQKTRININDPDRDKKLTKLMKEYAKLTRTKKTIVKYNSPSRKLYQITKKNLATLKIAQKTAYKPIHRQRLPSKFKTIPRTRKLYHLV